MCSAYPGFLTRTSSSVESEEEEIVTIIKIVLNLMKQNDHYNSQADATKDRA
jgi:hypothetical protein